MTPETQYDVFVSYSKPDDRIATTLAEALREAGLRVWFDRWSLVPGEAWQRSIEDAIARARSIVVCVGATGVGAWQQAEMQSLLRSALSDQRGPRVIPVILPGADFQLLPAFLRAVVSIDMRKGLSDEIAIGRLVSAIEGPRERSEIAQEQEVGDNLRLASDLDGATMHYERALRIARTTYGSAHPLSAELLNRLAGVQREMGNYSRAQSYLDEALQIQLAVGSESEGLSTTFNNLGSVLRDQGRLIEAMDYFQRALAIDEKASGSNNPIVANRLNNLGSVLRDQGRLEEAAAYFQRALAIDEKALGPDHPSSATVLNNLAGVYAQFKTGDRDANLREAIDLLERAHASFLRLGSAFETGQTLANLAVAYSRLRSGDRHDNLQRALHYCDEALRILRQLGLVGDQSETVRELQHTRQKLVASLAEPT